VSYQRNRVTPGGTHVEKTFVWTALGEAVERAAPILARIERRPIHEVRHALQLVAERVDASVSSDPTLSADALDSLPPASYVEVLRAEFLHEVGAARQAIDARTIVPVVKAFDDLRDRAAAAPHVTQFAQHLASASAMDAVIEIAHDMRSPLSSILFLVDTIRRGQSGPMNALQERQLGLIYGAAFGLSALASDALDAVRGHRLVDGKPSPFSIAETMLGVCAIVRPIGEEKGLALNTTFPSRDGRIGYGPALARVLLNLTSNALKFTQRGSVSIGCSELSGTDVEFWVSDTGTGIPDSVLAVLFDSFRPGASGVRFSSAGLGLAICRSLLEAMGSTLKVETEMNQGTRFSFRLTLPLAD
jgi:signal transduction histidine kinase